MKTVYDWILTAGQQVDYWHRIHNGWFSNCSAEEYAYEHDDPLSPHEMKLNGVVLTFEMLDELKAIPLPPNFPQKDTEQFWEDLRCGKYYNTVKVGDPE